MSYELTGWPCTTTSLRRSLPPDALGGRRIGAEPSDPLGSVRSETPNGYGTTGVQATAIGFPTEGCWEVIAR